MEVKYNYFYIPQHLINIKVILLIMVGITYSELVKDAIFDPSVNHFLSNEFKI